MKQRVFFLLVLAFWLVMNWLLFQAEYGQPRQTGVPVATAAVWQRMITAPDSSSLEIIYNGQKWGVCRWMATVGEQPGAEGPAGGAGTPDGMVRRITGYTIDFDGNLMLRDFGHNVRFFFRLNLATNYAWRDLHLRTNIKPEVYEIHADAEAQRLTVRLSDPATTSEYQYSFEELRNPRRLLQDFEVPLPVEWLLNTIEPDTAAATTFKLGLDWEARHDTLTIGQARLKVYRLQARLLESYHLVVYVSRAGEILRVELPGNVSLVNYGLSHY